MSDERHVDMSQTTEHLSYSVPGLSCDHCRTAVTAEVAKVGGVSSVEVDLDTKHVLSQAPWEKDVDPLEGFYLHELRRRSVPPA